jgi:hypothetical protein
MSSRHADRIITILAKTVIKELPKKGQKGAEMSVASDRLKA